MDHRPGFTGNISRAAARRPWLILGIWVALLVGAFAAASTLTISNETDIRGTESKTATDLINERLREETPPEEFVIVESETLTADAVEFGTFVDSLASDLGAVGEVSSVVSYRDGGEGLVSDDGGTALIIATLSGDESDAAEIAEPIVDLVEAKDGTDGFRVTTAGTGSIEIAINELVADSLGPGTYIGLLIALVVLIIVFGALVAAGLPIIMALLSIILAIGATALVSNVMGMSQFVVVFIVIICLAVGIDYSLFIVQRFREERVRGLEKIDAITAAGATASRAVFFSGMAVALALAGMLIMPDPVFQSIAVGAIFGVFATIVAAMTLLPAVLGLLGDRVNWGKLPFIRPPGEVEGGGRFWTWITRVVAARPALSILLAGGLFILLAVPFLNINLGTLGVSALPANNDQRYAFEVVSEEFLGGVLTADIVIDAPNVNAPEVQSEIADLTESLEQDEFFGEWTIETNDAGDLALVTVAMPGDFSAPESKDGLARLRGDYIPEAFPERATDVFVGGATAETVDSVQAQWDYLPSVFLFVLGLSFLLLLMVFRSVVVPMVSVVFNLLSVGAAYGAMVLVFQEGIGAELFGFDESPIIESWLPLFLFAILFGLSMDYHVFLLSRIKERYDETGDNTGSIAFGLGQTAAIITGVALTTVAVFAGIATSSLVLLQQVGFGLAFEVILDATLIRMVLVPATMHLLGKWNWYFPRWLEWLPEINIEGAQVQGQR
jgi:RND superfamily putative drug exporter